jgi:hypothetical protein
MNVFVTLGGALAFLAVIWTAATFFPNYFSHGKASGPDAGASSAAGGTYGPSGSDDCSDGGCD